MLIFEFEDYRDFLKKRMERLPNGGRGEINRLAGAMQVHPSLVSQVLHSDKNLSIEQAHFCCEYLGFTDFETTFFLTLVQFHRAGTNSLKKFLAEQLAQQKIDATQIKNQVRQDAEINEEARSIFYSHWLYAAIWLQTSLTGGQTVESIARFFEITNEKAATILRFLQSIDLCHMEDNRFTMGSKSIHLEKESRHLNQHYTNWHLKALATADTLGEHELIYTAPCSVSKADLKKVHQLFVATIKQLTEMVIASEAEELICVNLDLFRIRK